MSQSPRAALNALGLFAAEAPGRARAHVSAGWRPPLFRRRSPIHFSATYLNRFEDGGADCGTSLDGVLRPWSLLPRPRTRRFLDRPCVARRSMGCSIASSATTFRPSSRSSIGVRTSLAPPCSGSPSFSDSPAAACSRMGLTFLAVPAAVPIGWLRSRVNAEASAQAGEGAG